MKWKRSKKAAQEENKGKTETACFENGLESNKYESSKPRDHGESVNDKNEDVMSENFKNKRSDFSKSSITSHFNNGCSTPSLSEFKSIETLNSLCPQVWPVNLNRHLSECNRNISNISITSANNSSKKLQDPFYRPYVT